MRIADNLARFPRIVVPRPPVDGYTAPRVLTMEFIKGGRSVPRGCILSSTVRQSGARAQQGHVDQPRSGVLR